MRNSAVTAIGPALEGSWIVGVTPSIEPASRTLFAEGAGGARGLWNLHLVEDLRRLNLWDDAMREELRLNERSLQQIERIPQSLREIYRTAFEIEPRWLIECAARRQKWIDQGQSLTLYAADSSLETLSEIYLLAWERGLITTNRLRIPGPPPFQKPLWKSAPVETSAVLPAAPAMPASASSDGG
jgi:ribonucleoside-diphosphate reductase alpha chain